MQNFSDEQLLHHMTALGQWTQIRARELQYFTEQLPGALAKAAGNPEQEASLVYALTTYVDGVQDLVDRYREVQEELARRLTQPVPR